MAGICVPAHTLFKVTQQATLFAVIRHCVTDSWNLLTHLQFQVNAATLEGILFTEGTGGGGAHLATHFGYTRQTFHSSKSLRGKSLIWLVVSAAAFAFRSSAFEA